MRNVQKKVGIKNWGKTKRKRERVCVCVFACVLGGGEGEGGTLEEEK